MIRRMKHALMFGPLGSSTGKRYDLFARIPGIRVVCCRCWLVRQKLLVNTSHRLVIELPTFVRLPMVNDRGQAHSTCCRTGGSMPISSKCVELRRSAEASETQGKHLHIVSPQPCNVHDYKRKVGDAIAYAPTCPFRLSKRPYRNK